MGSATGIALPCGGWNEGDIRRTTRSIARAGWSPSVAPHPVCRPSVAGAAVVIAYCWADGVIELGHRMPDGAIEVARGGEVRLRHAIAATAALMEDGSFCLPSPFETIESGSMLAALEDYVAWLYTLDLGIHVNHPIESLQLLHTRTQGHGAKCADLHEALRLEFALDHHEAELACLLLQKRHLPIAGAGVHTPETQSPASFRTLLAKTGSLHLVDLMQRLASVVV
jgi:hypothetical protein